MRADLTGAAKLAMGLVLAGSPAMRAAVTGLCLLLLAATAAAQTIPYLPGFDLNKNIYVGTYRPHGLSAGDPRLDTPPTLKLSGGGAPDVDIWVGEADAGIVILGQVHSRSIAYASTPAEMQWLSFVRVRLATVAEVSLPPIGWIEGCCGLQGKLVQQCPPASAFSPSSAAAAVEHCEHWMGEQGDYRANLRRVFVRSWDSTGSAWRETAADPAWRNLSAYVGERDDRFAGLEPEGHPKWAWPPGGNQMANQQPGDDYFQVAVPWDQFPPADTLQLSRLSLDVEFCSRENACATPAPAVSADAPSTWPALTLARPRISEITPCGYPLAPLGVSGAKFQDTGLPGWYLPRAAADITKIFSLQEPMGYGNSPGELPSPVPVWDSYFAKTIAPDQTVCGPDLRYLADGKLFTIATGLHQQDQIDADHLSVRPLAGGDYLLMDGPAVLPDWVYGIGAGGGCPAVTLEIFYLDPKQGITLALRQELNIGGEFSDGDIEFSPDLSTVTVYEYDIGMTFGGETGQGDMTSQRGWTASRYCRNGATYVACGSSASPPPRRRLVHYSDDGCTPLFSAGAPSR